MHLYIWNNFYPDYKNGLAFAIANSEEEAKGRVLELLKKELPDMDEEYFNDATKWGVVEVLPLEPTARARTGSS